MDYFLTCLIAGIYCTLVAGPECGLIAMAIGAVVVKVAKSSIVRPLK